MRNYLKAWLTFGIYLLLSFPLGCSTAGIPVEQYSALTTPQETFAFAQKSVLADDPEAFYYCLASNTQKDTKLSDLKLAWNLASSYFYLFLEAEIKSLECPAPEFVNNPRFSKAFAATTAKMAVRSNGLEIAFLLLQEEGKWKVVGPYSIPDLSRLKKRERCPWRQENLVAFRSSYDQWLDPKPIQRAKSDRIQKPRQPVWRTH